MKKNEIIILGSGTSTGIPVIGCDCKVCKSEHPLNKRLRSSIFITTSNGLSFIVDTSPDLRTQLLSNNITSVDFTFITHDHADHVHGIDDLRPLTFGKPPKVIPIYAASDTSDSLKARFPYIFNHQGPILGGGIPRLSLHEVPLEKEFEILGEKFQFFHVPHGKMKSLCFIHGKFGYIIDCQSIPSNVLKAFKAAKLDLLILDCLHRHKKPKQTHLSFPESRKYLEEIDAKKTGLIHMSHHIEHEDFSKECENLYADRVFPTYDGMRLSYPR